MKEMQRLSKEFNEGSDGVYRKGFSEGEVWTLLFKRQALIFDALCILFNEIQALKPEPRDLALLDGD